jgi:hypothetical protein
MGKRIKNHLDALDYLDAQIDKMKCQGYSINEINQSVIGRCFIEMNGILACIADSLENLEKEIKEDGKVQ